MTHTQNYNLSQWSPTDRILRSDFNTDNAAIDTALAAHDDALANLTAHKGNCTLDYFTYYGHGKCGISNPTRITFPRMPALYIIAGRENMLIGRGGETIAFFAMTGIPQNMSWSGLTLTLIDNNHVSTQLSENSLHFVFTFYDES